MIEVVPAIFKGKSATITWVKIKDGSLFIRKRNKLIPMASGWTHKAGHIADKLKIFEERPLFDPDTGKRGDMIRFYPFSLEDYKDDHTQLNREIIMDLESTRTERNLLARLVVDLRDLIKDMGMLDTLKKRMKDEFEYINQAGSKYVTVEKTAKKKK